MGQRLAVMETQQRVRRKHWVDLSRLSDDDLDVLERLGLNRQACPGSLEDWLAALAPEEGEELMRLHALVRWS